MPQILVDGILSVSFLHGILRIECGTIGRDGKLESSGHLLVPGAQAGNVLQAVTNATRELEKRHRENAGKAETPAAPIEH